MSWKVPRMWEGEDVWIIGGGSSVAEQFEIPYEVVQSVKNRTSPMSVYSDYMKAIHNKHVIAINVAYKIGDWIDMVFWGDVNFWLWYQNEICNWLGLKVTCHHTAANQRWVKFIEKDKEHPWGISTRPDRVSWNTNSGTAAISVAAWAGAARIFLLGFDMNLGVDKKMHFHDVYQRGKIEEEKDVMKWVSVFERQLRGFAFVKQDAQKMGIEIINVNPKSAITEFPRVALSNIL